MNAFVGKNTRAVIKNQNHQDTWPRTQIMNLLGQFSQNPTDTRKRKILEAYFIKIQNPTLNDQKDIKNLFLFRHGVT